MIQDMFPITEQYIEREYKIANNHLMLTSEQNVKVIERKAKKVRGMLKRRVKFMTTQPDVARMLDKLKNKKKRTFLLTHIHPPISHIWNLKYGIAQKSQQESIM